MLRSVSKLITGRRSFASKAKKDEQASLDIEHQEEETKVEEHQEEETKVDEHHEEEETKVEEHFEEEKVDLNRVAEDKKDNLDVEKTYPDEAVQHQMEENDGGKKIEENLESNNFHQPFAIPSRAGLQQFIQDPISSDIDGQFLHAVPLILHQVVKNRSDPAINSEEISKAQDGEEVSKAQDGEEVVTAQDGEEISKAQDGEEISKAQDGEEIDQAQDGEEIGTAQDNEKIATAQDGEELSTAQATEEIVTAQDGEELSTAHDNEEIVTVQDNKESIKAQDGEEISKAHDGEALSTAQDNEEIVTVRDNEESIKAQDTQESIKAQDGEEISKAQDGVDIIKPEDNEQVSIAKSIEGMVVVESGSVLVSDINNEAYIPTDNEIADEVKSVVTDIESKLEVEELERHITAEIDSKQSAAMHAVLEDLVHHPTELRHVSSKDKLNYLLVSGLVCKSIQSRPKMKHVTVREPFSISLDKLRLRHEIRSNTLTLRHVKSPLNVNTTTKSTPDREKLLEELSKPSSLKHIKPSPDTGVPPRLMMLLEICKPFSLRHVEPPIKKSLSLERKEEAVSGKIAAAESRSAVVEEKVTEEGNVMQKSIEPDIAKKEDVKAARVISASFEETPPQDDKFFAPLQFLKYENEELRAQLAVARLDLRIAMRRMRELQNALKQAMIINNQ